MIKTSEDYLFTASKKVLVLGAFLLAAFMALSMLGASPARASTTFTVSLTNDVNCLPDGCTLRSAITAANNTPNVGGPDVIKFDIPGTGPHTIMPDEALPTITDPVIIDGYSQPGASPNTLAKGTNAKPMIELDGENAGNAGGLDVRASGSVVRGLAINRFNGYGILICCDSATDVKIEGNFIGTDPTGTQDLGNGTHGVNILLSSGNTVGGATPEARNLISGNGEDGVSSAYGPSGNKVYGNLIGTKSDGKSALGNADDGVDIRGASANFVGGSTAGSANTIAFNSSDGVSVTAGTRNRILRNSIFSNVGMGVDLTGDGPTKNDVGDPDKGANGLQNKPALASAVTSAGKTTIKGKLNVKRNQSYVVRFFLNPPGADEGKKLIGQKKVKVGSVGKVSFTYAPSRRLRANKAITATVTDAKGNTSEFSAPRTVVKL